MAKIHEQIEWLRQRAAQAERSAKRRRERADNVALPAIKEHFEGVARPAEQEAVMFADILHSMEEGWPGPAVGPQFDIDVLMRFAGRRIQWAKAEKESKKRTANHLRAALWYLRDAIQQLED